MSWPSLLRCPDCDSGGRRCDHLRFHAGRHDAREPYGSSSWATARRETYEVDAPWITWTWLSTDRETRFTGRMRMRMICCVCGKHEMIRPRIPRFGPVPVPKGGRHPERIKAIQRHLHPGKGHPMSWALPLRNWDAHGAAGIDVDLLAMRLEADLNEAPGDA